jgi:hypothetical protein
MDSYYGIGGFKDKERIITVIRHHWFVLLREIIGLVILFLLPFFAVPLFWTFVVATGQAPQVPGGVVLFFASAWALVLWNLLFARWTDWYYDIWVVTNWRIVDIDQQGLFRRNVATLATLNHIQDLTAMLSGVIGTVLNFGNVELQTAASKREFLISEVPNPNGTVQIIREAMQEQARVFANPQSHHAVGE